MNCTPFSFSRLAASRPNLGLSDIVTSIRDSVTYYVLIIKFLKFLTLNSPEILGKVGSQHLWRVFNFFEGHFFTSWKYFSFFQRSMFLFFIWAEECAQILIWLTRNINSTRSKLESFQSSNESRSLKSTIKLRWLFSLSSLIVLKFSLSRCNLFV